MLDRLIVSESGGKIHISYYRAEHIAPELVGEGVLSDAPLGSAELEKLRWYLERYTAAPYAVWEEQGEEIRASFDGWGESLFAWLFGSGEPGRDAYVRARERGPFELWISSESPAFLGLPWELLRDPDADLNLAIDVASINRTIPVESEAASVKRGESLRVLMVIARPAGIEDVPYQMIARPLMERLGAVSGLVELEVLRPPTIEALRKRLVKAVDDGRPYDVLHFDGHGSFAEGEVPVGQFDHSKYQSPGGCLWFETESGDGEGISADDFATLLTNADVPLLVLNACQSATVAENVGAEATVATRLLQKGTSAVVAMGYSVYAVAAAEFMAVFYETLFAGKSVSAGVSEGRRRLHRANLRPSPKGPLELDDWIVPVHYARREVSFPQLKREAEKREVSLDDTLAEMTERMSRGEGGKGVPSSEDPLRADDVFFGRDREFYKLERALRTEHVVVVRGVGGTGKTELAKAFARWLGASGGVDKVYFHSFEPGAASFSLDGALMGFGLRAFGADFVRACPTPEERRKAVLEVMRRHRVLMIWDNFETVKSMPDPMSVTPPLDDDALDEIRAFVEDAAKDAQVGIIITSRAPEGWLSEHVHDLELKGLSPRDAAAYADHLLRSRPEAQKRRREEKAYGKLMAFLGGHPLSLRLILPLLDEVDAASLLAGLSGQGELPKGFEGGEGRLESLGASVHYSFRHLSEEDQSLLPAILLFESVVDANVLGRISRQKDAPARFRDIDADKWSKVLDRCAAAGLLTVLMKEAVYRIHPALPGYLGALWRDAAGDAFGEEYQAARLASIKAHAGLCVWLMKQIEEGKAETAMAVLALERATLGRVVAEALERQLYLEAQAILQPLGELWKAHGLLDEATGWWDRCRALLEDADGGAPDLDSDAGGLWLFVVGSRGNQLIGALDLSGAEGLYDGIRQVLEASDSEQAPPRLAVTYHQLGMLAEERGDFGAAEEWYLKSLEIEEGLGNRSGMSISYHQLGMLAEDRGDLASAEEWYRKSLEIKEALGNRPGMSATYHQLGILAGDRGDLGAAEEWYLKSLEIEKGLGNRPGMSISYHQLGVVAQKRGDLGSAEEWYRKALEIKEALADRPGMAATYHQLGILAQQRGDLRSAEEWYRKALEIEKVLGNRPGMARTYHQLGVLAQKRGDLGTAEEWYRKSLEIKEVLGNRPGMARTYHQLGMLAQKRGDLGSAEKWYRKSLEIEEGLGNRPRRALTYGVLGLLAEDRDCETEALDWVVRGVSLFEEFTHPATGPLLSHLARLAGELGMDAVTDSWLRCTGLPLPDHVRIALEGQMTNE
jgi:tetratricopeptide (TPR) repeat protein